MILKKSDAEIQNVFQRKYLLDLEERFTVLNKDNHKIPVVISIPHSGLLLTKEMNDNLVDDLVLANVDWYLPKLYSFLEELGFTVIINNMSRYVIDPNREIDFNIQDESYIHNFVYPVTTFGKEIYKEDITYTEVMDRVDKYYLSYHSLIEEALEEKFKYFDKVYLLDLHSFGNDLGVDIVLGNDYGKTSSDDAFYLIKDLLNKYYFKVLENDHFKGGYITRYYGNKYKSCEALQIEFCYKSYIFNREYGNEELPLIDEVTFKNAQERMKRFFNNLKNELIN